METEEASSHPLQFKVQKLKDSAYFKKDETSYAENGDPKAVGSLDLAKKKQKKRLRSSSPVWDIEIDQDLPEDAASVTSCKSTKQSKLSNERSNKQPKEITKGSLQTKSASISPVPSLRPSQSASQKDPVTKAPVVEAAKLAAVEQPPVKESNAPRQRNSTTHAAFGARQLSPSLTVLENTADKLLSKRNWQPEMLSPVLSAFESFEVSSVDHEADYEGEYGQYFGVVESYQRMADYPLNSFSGSHEQEFGTPAVELHAQFPDDEGDELDVDEEFIEYDDGELDIGEYHTIGEFEMHELDDHEALNEEDTLDRLEYQGEDMDFQGSATCDDTTEASFDSSPQPLYMEGRALLAGLGTVDRKQLKVPNRYNPAEEEVAATLRLKDHWRPQRL